MSEAEKTASIISEFRRRVKEQPWDEIGQADIAETATKLTSALSDDAVRANLHITVNPLGGLPTVKCAAAALEQIFFIIIQNAIEAADGEKRHKLTISAKSRDEKVELRFSDDCCGIAPENLEKIFEPFYTTKSDRGGMGLGLEIVRRILLVCGGEIHVESNVGKGTIFYVVLPAADSINS
jgi:signal transduction histidine kinase